MRFTCPPMLVSLDRYIPSTPASTRNPRRQSSRTRARGSRTRSQPGREALPLPCCRGLYRRLDLDMSVRIPFWLWFSPYGYVYKPTWGACRRDILTGSGVVRWLWFEADSKPVCCSPVSPSYSIPRRQQSVICGPDPRWQSCSPGLWRHGWLKSSFDQVNPQNIIMKRLKQTSGCCCLTTGSRCFISFFYLLKSNNYETSTNHTHAKLS